MNAESMMIRLAFTGSALHHHVVITSGHIYTTLIRSVITHDVDLGFGSLSKHVANKTKQEMSLKKTMPRMKIMFHNFALIISD